MAQAARVPRQLLTELLVSLMKRTVEETIAGAYNICQLRHYKESGLGQH